MGSSEYAETRRMMAARSTPVIANEPQWGIKDGATRLVDRCLFRLIINNSEWRPDAMVDRLDIMKLWDLPDQALAPWGVERDECHVFVTDPSGVQSLSSTDRRTFYILRLVWW